MTFLAGPSGNDTLEDTFLDDLSQDCPETWASTGLSEIPARKCRYLSSFSRPWHLPAGLVSPLGAVGRNLRKWPGPSRNLQEVPF